MNEKKSQSWKKFIPFKCLVVVPKAAVGGGGRSQGTCLSPLRAMVSLGQRCRQLDTAHPTVCLGLHDICPTPPPGPAHTKH